MSAEEAAPDTAPAITVKPSMSDRAIVIDIARGDQEILSFALPLQAGQGVYDGCHAMKESIEIALEEAYRMGHVAGVEEGKLLATTIPKVAP